MRDPHRDAGRDALTRGPRGRKRHPRIPIEMLSRPVAVFIAFVLFCSAFATYGQGGTAAPASDGPIATFLDAGAPERDAGSAAEQEPSDDSSALSQPEGGTDSPEGIPQLADLTLPAPAMARPRPLDTAAWRAVTLDGLRRPPRAGLANA